MLLLLRLLLLLLVTLCLRSSLHLRERILLNVEPGVMFSRQTQGFRDCTYQWLVRRQLGEMIDCGRGGKCPARGEEGKIVGSGQLGIGAVETGEVAGDVRFFLVTGPFEEGGWFGRDWWLLELLRTCVGSVVVQIYALEWEGAVQRSREGCVRRPHRSRACVEASIRYVLCISWLGQLCRLGRG